jgi:hypothetical protein
MACSHLFWVELLDFPLYEMSIKSRNKHFVHN